MRSEVAKNDRNRLRQAQIKNLRLERGLMYTPLLNRIIQEKEKRILVQNLLRKEKEKIPQLVVDAWQYRKNAENPVTYIFPCAWCKDSDVE